MTSFNFDIFNSFLCFPVISELFYSTIHLSQEIIWQRDCTSVSCAPINTSNMPQPSVPEQTRASCSDTRAHVALVKGKLNSREVTHSFMFKKKKGEKKKATAETLTRPTSMPVIFSTNSPGKSWRVWSNRFICHNVTNRT